MKDLINKTCCFIGHRKIDISKELEAKIYSVIESLITDDGIDTFLFGSRSEFDTLCYNIVSHLKKIYSHIKRIYVRGEFPYITDEYKEYLHTMYESTYYPPKILNSGRSAYVERNFEMINKSAVCVVYYLAEYSPLPGKRGAASLNTRSPKSGTRIAYNYAVKQKKRVINVAEKDKH